jgi:hypothetical protein
VSDHDALLLVILSVSSVRPMRASREVFNFDKVDWDGLNSALATKLLPVLQQEDVITAWEMRKSIVYECAVQFVPKKIIGGRKNRLPWIDPRLKQLISIRDQLFSKDSRKPRCVCTCAEITRPFTQRAITGCGALAPRKWPRRQQLAVAVHQLQSQKHRCTLRVLMSAARSGVTHKKWPTRSRKLSN